MKRQKSWALLAEAKALAAFTATAAPAATATSGSETFKGTIRFARRKAAAAAAVITMLAARADRAVPRLAAPRRP